MSLNELAVDLTCDPAPFTLPQHRASSSSHQPSVPEYVQEAREDSFDELDEEIENLPGSFPFPMDLSVPSSPTPDEKVKGKSTKPFPRARVPSESADDAVYIVHGGMLKMTRAMGAPGKPVHVAVRQALRKNKGYCTFPRLLWKLCAHPWRIALVLCGHSLGAGVAGLLALVSTHSNVLSSPTNLYQ